MTNSEKLERVDDELFRIGEAVEYLDGVRGMADVVGQLKDCMIVLNFERESYQRLAQADDEREDAALLREYLAAVL